MTRDDFNRHLAIQAAVIEVLQKRAAAGEGVLREQQYDDPFVDPTKTKEEVMDWFRYKPENYAPGSPLFLSGGYHDRTVSEYVVLKITPSGQIVAHLKDHPESIIRLTKRGDVVGEVGRWSRRSVVSREDAANIRRDERARALWGRIRDAAEAIQSAAHHRDDAACDQAFARLASAIEARRAETGTGSVACDESAVPQADAQTPSQDISQ